MNAKFRILMVLLASLISQWGVAQEYSTSRSNIKFSPNAVFSTLEVSFNNLPNPSCSGANILLVDDCHGAIGTSTMLNPSFSPPPNDVLIAERGINYETSISIEPNINLGNITVDLLYWSSAQPTQPMTLASNTTNGQTAIDVPLHFSLGGGTSAFGDALILRITGAAIDATNNYFGTSNSLYIWMPIFVQGALQLSVPAVDSTWTPSKPFMVIHDPPGDGSSAKFVLGKEFCRGYSQKYGESIDEGVELTTSVGIAGSMGLGVEQDYEFSVSLGTGLQESKSVSKDFVTEQCIAVTQEFSTSDFEVGTDADIFIGKRQKMYLGMYNQFVYDTLICDTMTTDAIPILAPVVGDVEFFALTLSGIAERIIIQQGIADDINRPNVEREQARVQVDVWNEVIMNYNNNLNNPKEGYPDINFSGGAIVTSSLEVTDTEEEIVETELIFTAELDAEFTAKIGANGFEGGYSMTLMETFGETNSTSNANSEMIEYTFNDDEVGDNGDQFSVAVFRNPSFGTPIFKLNPNETRTSCPYEGGYQRDQPDLSMGIGICTIEDHVYFEDIDREDPVVQYLNICNKSDEERTYTLNLDNNLNGAIVTVSGTILNNANGSVNFTVPAESCLEAILTIERNPTLPLPGASGYQASHDVYENLKLQLFPNCGGSPEEGEVDELLISVTFGSVAGYPDNCPGDYGSEAYDFENLNTGNINGQDNWTVLSGTSSVVNTTTSGDYIGSKAAGHINSVPNNTEGYTMSRKNGGNWTYQIEDCTHLFSLEYDFLTTSTLARNEFRLAADINNNGTYSPEELGLGLRFIGNGDATMSSLELFDANGNVAATSNSTFALDDATRFRIDVDVLAANGLGRATVYARKLTASGPWKIVYGLINVVVNFNSNPNEAANPRNFDGIYISSDYVSPVFFGPQIFNDNILITTTSDADSDNDGICDGIDLCPMDATNPDTDMDGVLDCIDACPNDPDNDLDGDGICGNEDTCPNDPDNDLDGDGICGDIDTCPNDPDNDLDGDGICGNLDICPGFDDAASLLYVNINVIGGNNDGTSWENAFVDLQDAIDKAAECSNITDIWVAAGIYFPTKDRTGNENPTDNREKQFYIKTDIAIYGGFAGSSMEQSLSDRDLSANTTVLSGDLGMADDITDNSYHVVFMDGRTPNVGITNNCILDGFTIRDGHADMVGAGGREQRGAGLFNDGIDSGSQCNPTIRNCFFTNNTAIAQGGAIFNRGRNGGQSNPTITNCVFYKNTTLNNGGTMCNDAFNGTSTPLITNSTLAGNIGNIIFNFTASTGVSRANIKNCILWNDQIEIVNGGAGSSTIINKSILDDGNSNGIINYPAGTTGTNNLDTNPLFVDVLNGDLQLQNCSPAINAGDATVNLVSTDIVGNTRIIENGIDMGAYEAQSAVAPVFNNCPETQSVQFEEACDLSLSDYRTMATLSSDCSEQALSYTQTPAPQSMLMEVGVELITLDVVHPNGESDQCFFNLNICPPAALEITAVEMDAVGSGDYSSIESAIDCNNLSVIVTDVAITGAVGERQAACDLSFDIGFGETLACSVVATEAASLAVSWLTFEASLTESQSVELQWQVQTDETVAFYQIERSANGQDFEKIHQIAITTDNSNKEVFNYTDKTPMIGQNYYRIAKYQANGGVKFSPTRLVKVGNQGIFLHPNPTTNRLNIQYHAIEDETTIVEIFGINGKLIHRQSSLSHKGDNQMELNCAGLAAGIYYLKLYQNNSFFPFQTARFIVSSR